MLAAGFFQVGCAVTLQRLYCPFVTEAGSRYVHILGVTAHPDGPRTTQQIRNLLMDLDSSAADFQFLVRDRAGQFADPSGAALAAAGIRAVTIPPRSPRANAFAERLALTTPDRGHRLAADLRRAAPEVDPGRVRGRYNRRRPHRSRQLHPPRPGHPAADLSCERIKRLPVLGGLVDEYERAA
jgi:putative transposase